jgi:hypothetical protein
MGLLDIFGPKWKHGNPLVRIEAIRRGDCDVATLAGIAKTDNRLDVRVAAVGKIEDQSVLVDIVLHCCGEDVVGLAPWALNRISNQALLGQIAMSASQQAIQVAAINLKYPLKFDRT